MWKKAIYLILICTLLFAAVSCGGRSAEPEETPETVEEPEEIELPQPEPEPEIVPLNPLTGLPLSDPSRENSRPMAVMLNDVDGAMPQCGTTDADMIFEYNAEGGITRMVAFFQEPQLAGVIGSIRSARPCFVETVLGMDAIYFHAGGSEEAINMIGRYGMDHINGGAGGVFWRDSARMQTMAYEHTLMTSGESLAKCVVDQGFRSEHYDGYSYPVTYVENAAPKAGSDASHITVNFSWYKHTEFDYNADQGRYLISQCYWGDTTSPYADGNNGVQVGVENVLVLRTTVYNSGDWAGHMVIDLQGSGSGTFFCGGKSEPVTWHKESVYAPFTYTRADGTPLSLQTGKTYVCVIGNDAELDVR